MIEAPEPTGKLGAVADAMVNGPEDETLDSGAIDWRACEESVRRLRQRIFTASKAGDLGRVRSLQRLMLSSRANTLIGVRRVTERNAGRMTAGVDGEVVPTPEAKADSAERVQRRYEPFMARPVRRVYIPKRGSSTKRRLLGIPVVVDRVHQSIERVLDTADELRTALNRFGQTVTRGAGHDLALVVPSGTSITDELHAQLHREALRIDDTAARLLHSIIAERRDDRLASTLTDEQRAMARLLIAARIITEHHDELRTSEPSKMRSMIAMCGYSAGDAQPAHR